MSTLSLHHTCVVPYVSGSSHCDNSALDHHDDLSVFEDQRPRRHTSNYEPSRKGCSTLSRIRDPGSIPTRKGSHCSQRHGTRRAVNEGEASSVGYPSEKYAHISSLYFHSLHIHFPVFDTKLYRAEIFTDMFEA
jgi:hypothetical protein